MHTRRLRTGEEMQDAIVKTLAGNALPVREIYSRLHCGVEGTETARLAFETLLASGRVMRNGCRVTFDYGLEILYANRVICLSVRDAAMVTRHTPDIMVNV